MNIVVKPRRNMIEGPLEYEPSSAGQWIARGPRKRRRNGRGWESVNRILFIYWGALLVVSVSFCLWLPVSRAASLVAFMLGVVVMVAWAEICLRLGLE